ncbi:MAG: VacJ family lipoprotein [Paracoccaceae bacterium]
MTAFDKIPLHKSLLTGLVLSVAFLSACAVPVDRSDNDPTEIANREVFEFNRRLDKAVIRPVGVVAGTLTPDPVRAGVDNMVKNLDTPGYVVNGLLQGRLENAFSNVFRFGINSTLGVAGIFDPATDFGFPLKETDFGETMHVWGAGEGRYLVVPVLGPTTERDLAGKVVDTLMNPTRAFVSADHKDIVTGLKVAETVYDRYDYLDVIDDALYGSADPYAQARLAYLQNRNHLLGIDSSDDYIDPYEDPYAE